MPFPALIAALMPTISSVITRLVPDKEKQEEIAMELRLKLLEQSDKAMEVMSRLDSKQADINLEEAKSENKFKSCWRPAVGWCGVLGLFWACVGSPVLNWVMVMWVHSNALPPAMDTGVLVSMLTGILGLGAYRTYEKKNWVN